jgi:hypothetical protein
MVRRDGLVVGLQNGRTIDDIVAIEKLIQVAARIEGGEVAAAPSNADLLRPLVKA